MLQKTLKEPIVLAGIGIHTGALSQVTLLPAAEGTGIVFVSESNTSSRIKVGTVVPEVAMHATVLKYDNWRVSTVEHLMAAVSAAGLTNLEIIVRGAEIPILDGSALLFWQSIKNAGIVDQKVQAVVIRPKSEIFLSDDKGRQLLVLPHDATGQGLILEYAADFRQAMLGGATFEGQLTAGFFEQEIAPARTFGFLEQLPMLRFYGLAKGTSLGNSVVFGDSLMNEMRFTNECVRHKVLDLIGDMALLGVSLQARVKAHKTSHDFNRLLVEHYLRNPSCWEFV
jgi:UDP-3-O-[3-hydroxymyristoyl] N-acetylglucosamine deacetylase